MYNCPICNKSHDTLRKISCHIQSNHKIDPKDVLFDVYPELFRSCKHCGIKIKHYISDSQSRKMCSHECNIEWRKSKKQSPETIAKRIRNTNQTDKEQTRRNTMLERYDRVYYCPDPVARSEKISAYHKGKSHTKEHHEKVIESKRINNNLKHSPETKQKISNSVKAYYDNDEIDHSVTIAIAGKGGRGYSQGLYNEIYYRSSYELKFLKLCEKYNIKVESAATKEFRIRYKHDGKKKYYYPDFYLPEFDIVVEIKPLTMLDYGCNADKINEGCRHYSFWLVTEEELEEFNFINEVNSFERILCIECP